MASQLSFELNENESIITDLTATKIVLISSNPKKAEPPLARIGYDVNNNVIVIFRGLTTDPLTSDFALDSTVGSGPGFHWGALLLHPL